MIARALILLALLAVIWRLVRSLFAPSAAGRTAGGAPGVGRGATVRDEMVRDRVCNTYLPRARAISLSVDGENHHFCSERCRQSFLAASER